MKTNHTKDEQSEVLKIAEEISERYLELIVAKGTKNPVTHFWIKEIVANKLQHLQEQHEREKRELIEKLTKFAQAVIDNDKTERYEYSKNDCDRNAKGELAGAGSRWSTPKEMAQQIINQSHGLSTKE